MNNLIKRAEAIARVQQRLALASLAEKLRADMRGARVAVEPSSVILSGRGLVRRWLVDPALRFVTGARR